jgi:hypothetical protein
MGEYEGFSPYMETKRLETLVDGIFAMTFVGFGFGCSSN